MYSAEPNLNVWHRRRSIKRAFFINGCLLYLTSLTELIDAAGKNRSVVSLTIDLSFLFADFGLAVENEEAPNN